MLIRCLLLWVVLSGGAVWDLKEHRIPNRWFLCGFLACWAGILWEEARGLPGEDVPAAFLAGSGLYIGAFLMAAAFLFPLFLFRMMGAGDLKLIALIFGCLGVWPGMTVIGYGFLIGAVLALIKMGCQRSFYRRFSYFIAYFRAYFLTGEYFPYYVPTRDGYGDTLHFAVCLWAGMAVYLIRG